MFEKDNAAVKLELCSTVTSRVKVGLTSCQYLLLWRQLLSSVVLISFLCASHVFKQIVA